jgi:hypothetical protein
MYVIRFLCVSLGSSTVQLHDSLRSRRACACSDASFCSQIGDCAWGVYYWRVAFCCAFLWAKGFNARDIHKEIFPVYSGKCLSCKKVHNWATNVSVMTKIWNGGAEVAETTVKRLLCFGFRSIGKAMGQVYQWLWRICREMDFFFCSRLEYHMF